MKEKYKLKKDDIIIENQTDIYYVFVALPFVLLFTIFIIYFIFESIRYIKDNIFIIFGIIPFILFFFFICYFMVKEIKKIIKNKRNIKINNFKIVEDKIYDRDISYDIDDKNEKRFYIYTKIYGCISVDGDTYYDSRKNESIYLVFCDGNEQKYIHNNIVNKNVVKKYLFSKYELSKELLSELIPYNESLGENNFKQRIDNEVNRLKKKKRLVICKKCNKKYKLSNQEHCPQCGEKYEFDIKDVIYELDWYEKE